MNLLFTNSGRRTYLIEYALELKNKGFLNEIFVADTNENTASFYISGSIKTLITPRVSEGEDSYLNALLNHCIDNSIDAVIPLMDFEFPVLSRNKILFENKGCRVVISDELVISNTLNKKNNYIFNNQNNIPTPLSYFKVSDFPEETPCVQKKVLGSGSIGISFHKCKKTISNFREGVDMLQELIVGQEYGIDVLNDLNGNFIHACCRKKIAMRSGETDKAEVVYNDKLYDFAKKISVAYKHIGNMDIDIIKDEKDNIWCIDINPRFGGGYPFTHVAGFNYLMFIIQMLKNEEITIPIYKNRIVGMKGIKMFCYEKK